VDRHRRRDVAAAAAALTTTTTTMLIAIVVVWLQPIFAAHRFCLVLQMQVQIASSSVSSRVLLPISCFLQSWIPGLWLDYLHVLSDCLGRSNLQPCVAGLGDLCPIAPARAKNREYCKFR
jgi:hypothetical protein